VVEVGGMAFIVTFQKKTGPFRPGEFLTERLSEGRFGGALWGCAGGIAL
jgi:hypothetical protein